MISGYMQDHRHMEFVFTFAAVKLIQINDLVNFSLMYEWCKLKSKNIKMSRDSVLQ